MFIGTDITEVNRIQNLVIQYDHRFFKKIFSNQEINYCRSKDNPFIHFSGTYSAKESVKKALLSSGVLSFISFFNIEVVRKFDGAPYVKLHGNFKDIQSISISISHTREYATSIAMVVSK
tara:strand:- start:273 stop:632 length:360 start_codon:yes stop_codon:yes gene_type:complete